MFSHLLSKLPASRPADWGHRVTVCIAAFSEPENKIALVSDSKVAFNEFSADGAVQKNVPLLGEYVVMVAGNDAARAPAIYNRVRKRVTSADAEIDEVAEVLFEECQRERDRITEAKVLSKHGYDAKTFRDKGKNLCTASVFFDIHSAMTQVSVSLDFLLVGFDEDGQPHIRFVNYETPPEDYDALGFYAIGTGAHAALSSLAHAVENLSLARHLPIEEIFYYTMAAKFMSESARDVGKDTFAVVVRHNERPLFPTVFGGHDYLREQWKLNGAPRMPHGIREAIGDILFRSNEDDSIESLTRAAKHCPRAAEVLTKLRNQSAASDSQE